MGAQSSNPEHLALIGYAQAAMNELLLREEHAFYLEHIDQGLSLLAERDHQELRAQRQQVTSASTSDALLAFIKSLQERFASFSAQDAPGLAEYFRRVGDWEARFYAHRLKNAHARGADAGPTITAATLQEYLRRRFPQSADLTVTRFVSLAGGFSKKTILFETEDAAHGQRSMVIRAEQPIRLLCIAGSDVAREYHMIQLMARLGMPIAEPLWLEEDRASLGRRFIVSRRADGETYGGNFGSHNTLRPALLDSIFANFVKLHNLRVEPDDPLTRRSHLEEWLPFKTAEECTHYLVNKYLIRMIEESQAEESPQLLRALTWLQRNVPEVDEPPAVLHIDFALNNLIIKNEAVTAVLDWETSRLGDPAEDIIWTQQNLAAHIPMPEFLRRYEAGTGRKVSAYRLAYSRVAKCALNAITCLGALSAIDKYDDTDSAFLPLALCYMSHFGSQFNGLIEAAEAAA